MLISTAKRGHGHKILRSDKIQEFCTADGTSLLSFGDWTDASKLSRANAGFQEGQRVRAGDPKHHIMERDKEISVPDTDLGPGAFNRPQVIALDFLEGMF